MFRKIFASKGVGFIGPLLILLFVFFNIPLLIMLGRSVSEPFVTFDHYVYLFNNPVYLKVMVNTLKIAILITVLCMIIGYPFAYWMTTLKPKWQLAAVTVVVLSFLVSILVRVYAWIVLLGNNGVVNSLLLKLGWITQPLKIIYNSFGVNIGTLNVLLPFFILPLYFSMLKIDQRLMKAAASLGASPAQTFIRVYFPLTIPALISSSILVFILTLGFYITPAILGGGKVSMIANVLDLLINQMSSWELASALSVILLIVTIVFYYISRKAEVLK